MKKNIILLLVAGFVMMLIPSCLGGSEETDISVYKDAQISSFTLSHDSVEGLSSVKFTIDQVNGYIFNKDSLPCGTVIEKVICSIEYHAGGAAGVQVVQESLGDSTIVWNGSDSLDFSQPVRFTVFANDGISKKTYTAYVNIHKVVPDSMVWGLHASSVTGVAADEQKMVSFPLSGSTVRLMYKKVSAIYRLFSSSDYDAKVWKEVTLEGFPADAVIMQITVLGDALYVPAESGKLYYSKNGSSWSEFPNTREVKTILGALRPDRNKPFLLSAIVKDESSFHFAAMTEDGEWTTGDIVPEDFPFSGFCNMGYERVGFEYLMVAAGKDLNGGLLNTVWGTSNAKEWALFTRKATGNFEKREGLVLTKYDDKLFMTGGFDEEGTALKDVYLSMDNGITWALKDSTINFPDEYSGRGYASIEVDSNNYMYIYGGKLNKNARHVDDIWRGRIYRLGFGKEK